MAKKILVGSPVRQSEEILNLFLKSLAGLACSDIQLDYYFIDDNNAERSRQLLEEFRASAKGQVIVNKKQKVIDDYLRNEKTHYWNESLVWKVAGYKNEIITYCFARDYDYLFLVDSDLLLHPSTLEKLVAAEKDIISEIFWTKWQPDSQELPQVWLTDQYNLIRQVRGEALSQEEINKRYVGFLDMLKQPGVYEVGGLGACTLISRRALLKGVNFAEIYNISFWGEDRHFCVRAAALGFRLYVDTHYPAFHMYRLSDLAGAEKYLERKGDTGQKRRNKAADNKLTLMMLVRNEADKILKRTLSHAVQYVDYAVILDDASTDETVKICKEILGDKLLTIVSNDRHGFANEIALRKQLWELTVRTDPDWILALDADEIFEDSIMDYIKPLINHPSFDYYTFRLYDMWDEAYYREDTYWQAHKFFRIFLTRYQPDFQYVWLETPQHCGRLPYNTYALQGCQCYIRLKHYGWSTPELREEKYKRYMEYDPEGKYGNLEQYKTILSPSPVLKKWE